jgi:hypothetical protein
MYLVDRDHKRVAARLLIGAIPPPLASAAGAPYDVSLEIKDFKHGGQARQARSALRKMAHFAIALHELSGSVTVDQVVLSTIPPAERQRALRDPKTPVIR